MPEWMRIHLLCFEIWKILVFIAEYTYEKDTADEKAQTSYTNELEKVWLKFLLLNETKIELFGRNDSPHI